MGQSYTYLYPSEWITEGSIWRPPDAITLRDEAGSTLGNSVIATLVMTLFDLTDIAHAIVNSVEQTNILNARSCTLSAAGVLVISLLPADTVLLVPSRPYELRRALVEFTWPTVPTKSDCVELTFVVRNVTRRPYVAP